MASPHSALPPLFRWFGLLLVGCAAKDSADSSPSLTPDSADGDSAAAAGCEIDRDADGACADVDCDDNDPTIAPGAPETCDQRDEDCDGVVDNGAGSIYYLDDDGDGYGANAVTSCEAPEQYADNGADCDDTNEDIHPGADEIDNGQDDDCDGKIDEDIAAEPLSLRISWSGRGVQVDITNGGTGDYSFGMAETGAGALGWFGETCIPGDEPPDYDDYGYDICHTVDPSGGFIQSVHPDLSAVSDGYTLFNQDIGNDGSLTYVLVDRDTSDCWVMGENTSYYAIFGCTER